MRKREDTVSYERTQMQKERVIERLKEEGCRITKQRLVLLDVILSQECSSCKEIFYEASRRDKGIGQSTVYRMIGLLEEIGAINRKNMYHISCQSDEEQREVCQIQLDDHTTCHLTAKEWKKVVTAGLKRYGYIKNQSIVGIDAESDFQERKDLKRYDDKSEC